MRRNDKIRAKGLEFDGETLLRVDLEIKEGGGDGGACAKSQQHDEEPAAVGAKQSPDDAPEHHSIVCATVGHHSPRRMGAGSDPEARPNRRALPRILTPAASSMITTN